jgi:hypothetical protein
LRVGRWRRRGRGLAARHDDQRLAGTDEAEDAAGGVLDVLIGLEVVADGDELRVVAVELRDVAADLRFVLVGW